MAGEEVGEEGGGKRREKRDEKVGSKDFLEMYKEL